TSIMNNSLREVLVLLSANGKSWTVRTAARGTRNLNDDSLTLLRAVLVGSDAGSVYATIVLHIEVLRSTASSSGLGWVRIVLELVVRDPELLVGARRKKRLLNVLVLIDKGKFTSNPILSLL